jgi:hypothetical protein
MRRKCSGSCAWTSSPGRGRWKSCRRESQKRRLAARSIAGQAPRSSALNGRVAWYASSIAAARARSISPLRATHQSLSTTATSKSHASTPAK